MKVETTTYSIFRKGEKTRTKTTYIGKETPETAPEPIVRLDDDELEAQLKKLQTKKKLYWILCVPCGIVTALGFGIFFPVGLVMAILAIVFLLLATGCSRQIKQLISGNITGDVLTEVFDGCEYRHNESLPEATVRNANLVYDWNEYSGSDFVRGTYKGHTITFSDIHLVKEEKYKDSDGDTRTKRETRFKGQWLVCELNREISSDVLIREKQERSGLGKKILGNRRKLEGDIETENEAFNAQFQILTADGQTAFYILTPHFMEFIMQADAAANARTYLCFQGNQVHIAVHNGRDSFEAGKDIKDIAAMRARIKGEVSYITAILNELLQNTWLFGETKEEVPV